MKTMKKSTKLVMYLVLLVFAAIWIFPIFVAVQKSVQVNGFESYLSVLNHPKVNYFRVIFNSFLISVITSACVIMVTTLGGYAFSKMQFKGRNILYLLLLACLAVPVSSVTMPIFYTIKNLNALNSYAGVIIPLIAFNAPMMLMMVRNYYDDIPDSLLEAATIDGANSLQIYFKIMLPLSFPILANIGTLTFVYSWNDYLTPLLILRDEAKYTVTLAATYFMETRSQTPEMVAQLYAALILMTIPSVVVYLFSQRYLQSGTTAGSVK
ncbi:carbohydrate ABC transporter permease [Enterococcus sp. OL5]|uniref:carbohydrate ABC transporter permease n=1 Tax=Enterococcus sp. OL5 TaxID=2590214 RepID=UPI00112B169B|nr:carbohydrate ABC transporter permease [Enterococcus sp. OL5]TPR56882.1 carbohydrate ABC transporter permease [Enterococcus sp. OL5]